MLYPEINKLRDEAGSRYYLVSMASKRARDLIDGNPKLDPAIKTNKPVSIAAEEIAEGLFSYNQIEEPEIDEEEEVCEAGEEEAEAEEPAGEADETAEEAEEESSYL